MLASSQTKLSRSKRSVVHIGLGPLGSADFVCVCVWGVYVCVCVCVILAPHHLPAAITFLCFRCFVSNCTALQGREHVVCSPPLSLFVNAFVNSVFCVSASLHCLKTFLISAIPKQQALTAMFLK